ncbi:GNAT family N-acetyltransferase [Paenibacillus lacisoli]|nr:GNAT family N-acetyltransferase [Paenibacillus sp. JX-17]
MNRQNEAIQRVCRSLQAEPGVQAIFLKGSLARGEGDTYSDVDLYCMVADEEINAFLPERIRIMEAYRPLIYWSEASFVGPQIVGVYDDGLHLDLYTVTYGSLPRTDALQVLYDPQDKLKDYVECRYPLEPAVLIRTIHEFMFTLLEFETAYSRGDSIWASQLGHYMAGDLASLIRYLDNPAAAHLGLKRLSQNTGASIASRMEQAMEGMAPSRQPEGVQILVQLAGELIVRLPEAICEQINMTFFDFMAGRIYELGVKNSLIEASSAAEKHAAEVELRFCRDEDEAVLAAFRLAEGQERFTAMPASLLDLGREDSRRYPVVITADDQVVGFMVLHTWPGPASYSPNRQAILLRGLSITKEMQGQGFGRRALQILPGFVQNHFADADEIVLGVNEENMVAKNLYAKTGFTDTGRRVKGLQGDIQCVWSQSFELNL